MKALKHTSTPYLVWMAIFMIVPLGLIVYFAFTDSSGAFTLDNLSSVGRYSPVILKSLWLAFIATVICLIIAYPLALILSNMKFRKQKMMLMLVMLPMWMNYLLRTYAWMTLLEDTGIINSLLEMMGFSPIQMIYTQGAVVLGMVYNYLPFMILPLYSIMVKLDRSVIHAAQDLGANTFNVFTKILIPLTMPGIMTGITMVFVPSVSTFIISKMLGGGDNILIGDLIELQFAGSAYNPNLGSGISLVLMIIILLCMSLMNQFDGEDKEGII
ncbi:MAG: ABC transporter permease [Clostridia bacterium]